MSNVAMMVPQGAETVFPKEEYARRVARLREQMAAKGFDLVLTSGPENIFYLSGHSSQVEHGLGMGRARHSPILFAGRQN